MCVILYTVVIAAMVGVTTAGVLPAGKCNTSSIKAVPIPYNDNANLGSWLILYVTDADPFNKIDHATVQMTPNGDGTYTEAMTIVQKDSTLSTQTYQQTYVEDVIIENSKDAQTGTFYHFHLYVLAVSDENAVLYYRCSETAGVPVHTRYIAIPKGGKLSKAGLKKLQDVDKEYNFGDSLLRLPYKLYPAV